MRKRSYVIALACLLVIYLANYFLNKKEEPIEVVDEPVIEEIKEETKEDDFNDIWKANKEINNDYIGDIVFESGIIDLPFVRPQNDLNTYPLYSIGGYTISDYENGCEEGVCTLNDAYLRTDWKTMKYCDGGSIFMEYTNTIYDQNIILYGHHYAKELDPKREKFFTPLEKYLDESFYKGNEYIQLKLEDETRRYQIAYVYLFHFNDNDYNNLQYFRSNYDLTYLNEEDEGYYQSYIDNLEKAKLYDTGVHLTTDDNTLTLQTCYLDGTQAVEVIVAKELSD